MAETKIIEIKVDYQKAVKDLTDARAEVTALRTANRELNKDYAANGAQIEKNNAQIKNLSQTINQNTKILQNEIKEVKGSEGAYQKLNLQYQVAAGKAKDLAASNTATAKEIKKAAEEANKLNQKLKDIDKTVGQSQRGVAEYERGIGSIGKKFFAMAGATAIIAGIGAALKNALETITAFDQQMANVSAITMATKEEMKQLRDIAIQLGSTTKFTATEVAGLEVELGKLGYTTQQIIDATGGVVMAAAATGEGLQKTAEIVGSVTMAFGLSAAESQRVADVMAQSFNATALGLDNFAESIKYVAPIAKQVGVSVEETAALLGALANSGIKGSMAGTALRRIFTELTKDGGTLQERLDQLAKSGLNLAGAQDEVGAYAKTALLVLKDQHELIPQLTKEFENSAGAAEIAAGKMMDTIKGQSTILKSTWDAFILSIENGTGTFSTGIKNVLKTTAEAIRGYQRLLMSPEELAKFEAKSSAQSRLKDFEKRAQSQKDYTKYLNEEIQAEKNGYQVKLDRIAVLKEEIRVGETLGGKWDDNNEQRQEEVNGLRTSVNHSIEYINTLGNLRRAKSDQTALEIKNQETLDKNNALLSESTDLTKEQTKELENLNKEKEREYNLNLRTKKQIEDLNAEIKKSLTEKVGTPTDPFSQKAFNKTAGGDLENIDENRKVFLENEANRLADELELAQGNIDATLEAKRNMLNYQMNMELSVAQLTADQKLAIEMKYAQYSKEINGEAFNAKLDMATQVANGLLNLIGKESKYAKLAAAASIGIQTAKDAYTTGAASIKYFVGAPPLIPPNPFLGALAAAQTGVIIANGAKSISDIYAVQEPSGGASSSSTTTTQVTGKYHSGKQSDGTTANSSAASDEIYAKLLKAETVLDPRSSNVFDKIINNMSAYGGAANITANVGMSASNDMDRLTIAVSRALINMPPPVLVYSEFDSFNKRIALLESNKQIK